MISVIIPTADRPGPLHRALRSLSRQTLRDFEVVVIDDGLHCPRPVVDSWRHDLNVTLIDGGRQGVSHARNTGLAAARGDWVAFLDDDDVYFPHHLATAHRALQDGHADLVYGGALVSPRWIEAVPRDVGTLPRKDYPFDGRFLQVANYIHTGAVVTRNFTATPVRFDETLTHCEDWDLWLALHLGSGYRFTLLDGLTCVYHQVPHTTGAVSEAYLASPTPFTLTRAYLFAKWPSTDPLVTSYRDWFRHFDTRLDTRIEHGHPVPAHVYEHAIRNLHGPFTYASPADPSLLDSLLPAVTDTRSARRGTSHASS
ncbi:Glycosyl transferase family 2 [Sinosporangium album]|uniref:Glycosyl transferase family 2 n=1 Tax=Sinosporangium album TaxID=504805 RepID=A0A1G8KHZ9_9ACTN|nr:glycosyltransferase family A protein [Sinosporangium album]SDI43015.1 Glycosyl transferase family 2 [Sinosporangium album]